MIRKAIWVIAIAYSLQTAFAQDFKKSYSIAPGGHIWISTLNGNIKVAGFKGERIEIIARKKGPDSHLIKIRDMSAFNRVDLSCRYLERGHFNAKVDYEIRVPESIEYNFFIKSFFSGDIEISRIVGNLRAESANGSIKLKEVQGKLWVSSLSGNISADIVEVHERSEMRLDSISGNISVQAPSGLDAWIHISSRSGSLKSDFPIEIMDLRYGPGQIAHGKIGSGLQVLRISSNTGEVSLLSK